MHVDYGLIGQILGTGGVAALLSRLLGYRERAERRQIEQRERTAIREQEKYWRLVDEQQGTIKRQEETIERMRDREIEHLRQQSASMEAQAAILKQLAEVQTEANQSREARAYIHQKYDALAAKLEVERQESAGKIASLEAELASARTGLNAAQGEIERLKGLLAEHGITDQDLHPKEIPHEPRS